MRWFLLLAITMLLPIAAAKPTWAQEVPPALVVRLRDVMGAGIVGAAVIVTDDSGVTVLARATSDAGGFVRFGPLPTAEVRVIVQGRLADDTPLVLPGADAQGIPVILGAPPVMLELRSEADGKVLPDPEVELTLEPGVEAPLITVDPAQVPPAPPASAAFAATVSAFPTTHPANTAIVANSQAAPTPSDAVPAQPAVAPLWAGVLFLGVLILAVAAVVVVQLRWRRP